MRALPATTVVQLDEGASMEMETTRVFGIDDTLRKTAAILTTGAGLTVHEKVMTTGNRKPLGLLRRP